MRRSAVLALPLALGAVLTGCGSSASTAGASGQKEVLAAAYPFTWAAEQVGGPDVRVTNLVKAGVEPHDIELAPRQVGAFQSAALVVYLRGFQPAVDAAIAEAPKDSRLDLTPEVAVQDASSDLSGGGSGGVDPHVWLDPVRMQAIVKAVRDRLSAQAPQHKAAFAQRADVTLQQLTALDQTFRDALRSCARHDIVTSHSAFAYLAARYGLKQVGISGLSPEAEPAPGRLAEVAGYARTHGVTTIFFEALVSPKVADTVASEVGARTAVLDPLEGVRGGDDYLTVQRRNAAVLHTALGCA
ncbi:MAG: zinc transporter substrate-binding protein [Frankiales bacterium]|jgi:zinc transport system substrate-binding protein|nr:zinc transporter substrate-binding protein [Frankiales bacterium]